MTLRNLLAYTTTAVSLAAALAASPVSAQQASPYGQYQQELRGGPIASRVPFNPQAVNPQQQAYQQQQQQVYQQPVQPQPGYQQPGYRQPVQQRMPVLVAERPTPPPNSPSTVFGAAQPNEHPLMPALRWAQQGLKDIENIKDYSCTMVKRERVNGELSEYNHMFVKIRHQPFSVYMYFLGPEDQKGQEVIWIKGQNNGLMWAHGTGLKRTMFGTVSLKPTGPVAMAGQRYPLTEIGILNMVRRLIEIGEKDSQYGECEVKFFEGAKINDRSCTCIQVVHPVPRRNFLFHVARIFVDDELNLPVRYEAYDWPKEPGGAPVLSEEYTFLNLKVNNGFTDADFDVKNPNYQFP